VERGLLYLHDQPDALRFEVRGGLDETLLAEMRASLATARSMLNGRPLVFDLRRASWIAPGIPGQLAALAGAGTRILARDEQLPDVSAALPREARLVEESRFSPLRQAFCFVLHLLRPGCSCSSCQPQRVWSVCKILLIPEPLPGRLRTPQLGIGSAIYGSTAT
jgi:hypothetical protein